LVNIIKSYKLSQFDYPQPVGLVCKYCSTTCYSYAAGRAS